MTRSLSVGEGKQKLALETTFLPEMTPHLEEGGIRKSYTVPAVSIKEASGSLGTVTQAPIFFLLSF